MLSLTAAATGGAALPTQPVAAAQVPWRQLQRTAAQTGINAFYRNTTYANVAFTAAVAASSSPVLLHDAASVTDGDLQTSWLSDSAANQRLELDLGRPVVLSGYRIAWEGCGRGATSYELQGSLSSRHTALGGLREAMVLDTVNSVDIWSTMVATGREDSAILGDLARETQVQFVQLVMSSRRNTAHGLCDEYGVREIELFEASEHADECDGFEFPAFVVDEIGGSNANDGSAVAPFRSAEFATKQLIKLVQQRPACVTADGLEISFASSSRRNVVVFFGTESCGQTAVVCLRQPEGPLVCYCGINEVALEAYSKQCAPGSILNDVECEDIDECEVTPCFNGSECRDSSSHDYIALGHFQCICQRGWTGETCAEDVDECAATTPCENGGTCINGPGPAYSCRCPQGFQGPECRDNYDECLSQPCKNSAHCTNQVDGTGYDCHCVAGYAGYNCEIDVDECGSTPCLNGAVCSSLIDSYSCLCVDGRFEGSNCEQRVNPCDARPCANGALCQASPDSGATVGFQCFCVNGYTGETCSERVDHNLPSTSPPSPPPPPPPPPSPPPVVPGTERCAAASVGLYLCASGRSTTCQYIPLSMVNDGVIDCADGSDESNRGVSSSPLQNSPPPPPPPLPQNGIVQSEGGGDEVETETVEPVAPSPCEPSCAEGEYCDATLTCYSCEYIEPSRCDFVGGDCCSIEFLQNCPSDPAECSETSPLVYALMFVGAVALVVLALRCARSRGTRNSAEKQYALVSTGAGDDAWDRCVSHSSLDMFILQVSAVLG